MKLFAFVVPALAAGLAQAAPVLSVLVQQGDNVPGIGQMTTIDAIAVNNSGTWLVAGNTNHSDANANFVVLRNGTLYLRENDPVDPPPAAISSFDSVALNNHGNSGWNFFLRNTGSTSNDSGVYYNTSLVIQESFISTAPEFSAGTPYIGFFECRMNDNNQIFIVASVDDPNIPTSVDRALVWVDYDPGTGSFTERVLAKEGDILPGVSDAVVDFGTTADESFSITNSGSAMYVCSLTGATATNGAIYRDLNLIHRKGDESPLAGRTYNNIGTSTKLAMNNNGDYVFKVDLTGDAADNQVLIRNGQLFAQEGTPAPGLTETIVNYGTGPVRINDNGDVIWYAQISGDANTNQVLYLNDRLLVRKGVTQVGGRTITTIGGTTATGGIQQGFDTSRNGRYIIFRGRLDATTTAAIMIDMGET